MRRPILAATVSAISLATSPALAQDKADAPSVSAAQQAPEAAPDSGDIIVTATRESTLLSKTPVAMTAITGDHLRDAGITDARMLQDHVPNLFISQSGQIAIRGVTSSDGTEKGDPSAAFLLDGIYIARPVDVLGSFYDLERIEVLRGPQGTLYGRNTTAGVINVISAPPVNKFEASVDGQYGNLGSGKATGMVNVPLGGSIAVRAAVNYDREDNYLRKGVPSAIALDPFRNAFSGRLSIGGDIGKFHFVIRGDYSEQKGTLTNAVPLQNFFPGTLVKTVDPVYVAQDPEAQRSLPYAEIYPGSKDRKAYGIQGELSYDLGIAKLTYLGAYRESHRDEYGDALVYGLIQTPATYTGDFAQQSHELRLAFGQGGPLHGQVGAYYFREQSTIESLYLAPAAQIIGGPTAVAYGFAQDPTVARSIAGFGQLTYDLTPDLHLTGGIRYTEDRKSRFGETLLDVSDPASGVVTRVPIAPNAADRKFTKTTWRAAVDYDAPGLGLLYGSVSTGYKAGGFNDGCVAGSGPGCALTSATLYYRPETLTAYEAGFKFRFMDNAVRLNGSVFHYDYKDLQVSQIGGTPPQTLIRNAASAKVDGVELEAVLAPSPRDQADLSFTYTNARYTDFTPDSVDFPNFSFDGKELDRAPKYVAAAGYMHTFPLGNGGRLEASARTQLSSEYFLQDLNNLSQFRQPSYTKTDVTFTYRAPGESWYIQGFAKNLEDSITISAAASGIVAGIEIDEPRTYGVRAGFKF
jgi:iron complex outermembrane receptor protein